MAVISGWEVQNLPEVSSHDDHTPDTDLEATLSSDRNHKNITLWSLGLKGTHLEGAFGFSFSHFSEGDRVAIFDDGKKAAFR